MTGAKPGHGPCVPISFPAGNGPSKFVDTQGRAMPWVRLGYLPARASPINTAGLGVHEQAPCLVSGFLPVETIFRWFAPSAHGSSADGGSMRDHAEASNSKWSRGSSERGSRTNSEVGALERQAYGATGIYSCGMHPDLGLTKLMKLQILPVQPKG